MINNYAEMVAAFNTASDSHYNAAVNFLKFRHTCRGILVGWFAAKPEEIKENTK